MLDFGTGVDIGKPIGTDIKEKKMSLPLIYSLQQGSYAEKKKIINLIKNHSEEHETIEEVFNFVKAKKGFEFAKEKMNNFKEQGRAMLNEVPNSDFRRAFENLI